VLLRNSKICQLSFVQNMLVGYTIIGLGLLDKYKIVAG